MKHVAEAVCTVLVAGMLFACCGRYTSLDCSVACKPDHVKSCSWWRVECGGTP